MLLELRDSLVERAGLDDILEAEATRQDRGQRQAEELVVVGDEGPPPLERGIAHRRRAREDAVLGNAVT